MLFNRFFSSYLYVCFKASYQYSTQILVGNLDEFNKENSTNKTQENKQLVTSYVDILKSPLIISTVKNFEIRAIKL